MHVGDMVLPSQQAGLDTFQRIGVRDWRPLFLAVRRLLFQPVSHWPTHPGILTSRIFADLRCLQSTEEETTVSQGEPIEPVT